MLFYSEIYKSLEGEGPYTGQPTIFVRLFGCNLTCHGFGNGQGCDSKFSWEKGSPDRKAIHTDELVTHLQELIDQHDSIPGENMFKYYPILSFTGGEPMLQQDELAAFITQLRDNEYLSGRIGVILIETNATVPVRRNLRLSLQDWLESDSNRLLVWSNSPKLSNSGEPAVKTIFPSVIVSQQLGWSGHTQVAQYLKFVIEPDKFAESELLAVIDFYDKELMNSNRMLIPPSSVYLMPEGVSKERQLAIMPQVATIAMRLGFSLCVRLHTLLWDNHRGT